MQDTILKNDLSIFVQNKNTYAEVILKDYVGEVCKSSLVDLDKPLFKDGNLDKIKNLLDDFIKQIIASGKYNSGAYV